ncbi:MAG: hypothetical protein Q9183_001685 [Haloplaca sp. 2 TL-2023]
MGICSSCLGLGRRSRAEAQNAETARLLSDNPYRSTYGARTQNTRLQNDRSDVEDAKQREREILQGIAHQMSE